MIATLQVEVIGNMQRVQMAHKSHCTCIVRLILCGSSKIDMKLPCCLVSGQRNGRTILLHVRGIFTPDRPFSIVIAPQGDNGTKDIGMMYGDIHGAKSPHRKPTKSAMCGIRNRTIVLVNILHEVSGNERLDQLAVIKAIGPFASYARSSIAIRQDHNKFRNLVSSHQCIGGFIRFAPGNPVDIFTWRAMQQVEYRVAFCLSFWRVIRWWEVDQERSVLSIQSRTHQRLLCYRTMC